MTTKCELPYQFRAFREDDLIYLYDDLEDVYLCCLRPAVWCECIDHDTQDPDPHYGECSHYRDRKWIDRMDTVEIVTIDPDPDCDPEVDKEEAWETAREMVICNGYGGLY